MTGRVLGVDGCRDGWVGVAPDQDVPRAYAAASVESLLALAEADGAIGVLGIDIPIGLTDDVARQADALAQQVLGSRRASIFVTPVRAALTASDHASGVVLNRAAVGAGFSIQAWGLREKVLEVDALVRAGERRVHEVHPEVTFAEMGGQPAAHPKKTWAGQQERLALLSAAGIDLAGLVGDPGRAAPDDVVDAAACAWTARRIADGTARTLPDPPQPTPDGLRAAIWV